MKWLMVQNWNSNLRDFLNGRQLGIGTPAPAQFLKNVMGKLDQIVLVLPWPLKEDCPPKVENIRVLPLRAGSSFKKLQSLIEAYRVLNKLVEREKPDLIYAGGYYGIPASAVAQRHEVPCIGRFYGTFLSNLSPQKLKNRTVISHLPKLLLEYAAFKMSRDGLVVTDDGTCGDIICKGMGIASENVLFIKNGIDKELIEKTVRDTKREEVRHRYGLRKEDFVIASVSRLAKWKRVDLVIKSFASAMRHSKRTAEKARLIVAGDGSQRKAIEELSNRMGISNRVRFVGAKTRSETLQIMFASDVITSLYEVGNIGNVLLEAMYLGRAVIVRKCGETRLFDEVPQMGFLVEKQDDRAMKEFGEVVSRLIDNRRKVTEVGSAARKFATEKLLDWDDRVKVEFDWISERIRSSARMRNLCAPKRAS